MRREPCDSASERSPRAIVRRQLRVERDDVDLARGRCQGKRGADRPCTGNCDVVRHRQPGLDPGALGADDDVTSTGWSAHACCLDVGDGLGRSYGSGLSLPVGTSLTHRLRCARRCPRTPPARCSPGRTGSSPTVEQTSGFERSRLVAVEPIQPRRRAHRVRANARHDAYRTACTRRIRGRPSSAVLAQVEVDQPCARTRSATSW